MNIRIDDFRALKEMSDRGSLMIFEAIPAAMADFRPVEGMMSVVEKLHHLSFVDRFIMDHIGAVLQPRYVLPEQPAAGDLTGVLETLRETFRLAAALLDRLTDDDLDRQVVLGQGERRETVLHLLQVMVEHQLHHRGQLIVYFRAMGLEPPRRWRE